MSNISPEERLHLSANDNSKAKKPFTSEHIDSLFMLTSLKLHSRKLSEHEEKIKLLEGHFKRSEFMVFILKLCFNYFCFVFPSIQKFSFPDSAKFHETLDMGALQMVIYFQSGVGVDDKRIYNYGRSKNSPIYKEVGGGGGKGFIVKLMYRADCVKGRGTWTVKRFKGNGLGKEEDVIFLTGVHTAIYTMLTNTKYFVSKIGV